MSCGWRPDADGGEESPSQIEDDGDRREASDGEGDNGDGKPPPRLVQLEFILGMGLTWIGRRKR